ncbi:uncharacterized protein RB166_010305 [Leptodactylus fuscus]|uniref:uncharacterized protein LOC142209223 n=1 Tax=Leptodactylus fuscus TaxID=238119 RepID=UPI003F4E6BE5
MKMFLISVVLSFILIPGQVMSSYITQSPKEIDLKVGESAAVSCSVSSNIDIKEIQFWKRSQSIVNLTVKPSDISSTLSFFGTLEKFNWIADGYMGSYTCIDKTDENILKTSELPNETNDIDCPSPKASSTSMLLMNGSQEIASLSTSGEYRSRLQVSGTIRNLTITLKGLTENDTDSYECKGRAEGIGEELTGASTMLIVRSHGISRHADNLGLAFIMALASCVYKMY